MEEHHSLPARPVNCDFLSTGNIQALKITTNDGVASVSYDVGVVAKNEQDVHYSKSKINISRDINNTGISAIKNNAKASQKSLSISVSGNENGEQGAHTQNHIVVTPPNHSSISYLPYTTATIPTTRTTNKIVISTTTLDTTTSFGQQCFNTNNTIGTIATNSSPGTIPLGDNPVVSNYTCESSYKTGTTIVVPLAAPVTITTLSPISTVTCSVCIAARITAASGGADGALKKRPKCMDDNMRSGSSELLLEQQQQELKVRKLRELAPKKKNGNRRYRSWRERVRFYSTSMLVFFSVTAGASLLFLVPLYVDPAISTITHDFIENPTLCTTTRRENLIGIFNCSWSSCREGCTSDLYRCVHIYVTFIEENITIPENVTDLANFTTEWEQSHEATLFVNIKGCGYPPTVTCSKFNSFYGVPGAIYPCYYSRKNKTVVMTSYNHESQVAVIIHFFAVPFVITLISSIALCVMHCDCRYKRDRNRRRNRPQCGRPRIDNLSDTSISTRVDMLTPAVEAYKSPL